MTSLRVSPLGFGAFKIGRNQGAKYPSAYDLPTDEQVNRLLDGLVELGVTYFDTAPAYGLSEARLGAWLATRSDRAAFTVSTKVGETFVDGVSTYRYDRASVNASLDRSLARLGGEALDLVFVHSDGQDMRILEQTDVAPTLLERRDRGDVRAVGFSGKTPAGARAALAWADVLMVAYHQEDASHEQVMREAAEAGVGVVVKKGLASGRLDAASAIRFVLGCDAVTSLVVGGLNIDHFLANVDAVRRAISPDG